MRPAERLQPVSIEDYLAGELSSVIKHEYLGGVIYAMVGGRNAHNLIASNLLITLGSRLRGKGCRAYNSDTKIRIRLPSEVRFYYPDASVICRSNPAADSFQDEPVLVAEVISRKTRRVDEGEKKDAYLTLPSLSVYLLIEQEMSAVVVHRRTEHGFVREVHTGTQAVIPLREIGTELPLAEIYEQVEIVPEADED
jgi:Uma2 family endonuclease